MTDTNKPTIKINYRIIEVDEYNHAFVVRYWTDNATEDSLATVFDDEGKIVRGSDGKPVRCQSDFNISLYDVLHPSKEHIEKLILHNMNVVWLYTKDKLVTDKNLFDMSNVKSMANTSNSIIREVDVFDTDVIEKPNITLSDIKDYLFLWYPNNVIGITRTTDNP